MAPAGDPQDTFGAAAVAKCDLTAAAEAGIVRPVMSSALGKLNMRLAVVLPLLLSAAGCPVTQPQQTPVQASRAEEPKSGAGYWLYVPSYYSDQRDWPLVVTLHGTFGWDNSSDQIREWKFLAEKHGLIVAAPDLRSVQGILPVVRSLWRKDLQADEKAILSIVDELCGKYRIDPNAVLLTGFSAGGYPLYYVGLRNPRRFNMLIARACNSDLELFEQLDFSEAVRKLPVAIFWGKDDLAELQSQSWQAFRYLREHGCLETQRKEVIGGHLRRPEFAYSLWRKYLPKRHRM
jgi:poly(3-hydroxybutyrate) depolymerase